MYQPEDYAGWASGMPTNKEGGHYEKELLKYIAGSLGIPSREFGGLMQSNKPYLVGENGPEIVYPQQTAMVQPNPASQPSNTSGAVKPVTTTIKYDPTTGGQTMTIKGSPHQLSSAVAGTPTVNLPGIPQAEQMGLTQAQMNARNADDVITRITNGQGVAPVQPEQQQPTLAVPQQQQFLQQPQQQNQSIPVVEPTLIGDKINGQQTFNVPTAQSTDIGKLTEAKDYQTLAGLIANPNVEPGIRTMAEQAYDQVRKETLGMEQGKEELRQAAETGDLAKVLGKEEGSWGKLALFQLLGWKKAAEDQYEKLGIGDKFVSGIAADGKTFTIRTSIYGRPIQGARGDGTAIPENELVQYAAYGGSATGGTNALNRYDIVGGTVVNDAGEVGRVVTDKINPANSYVQTSTGRKPLSAGWRPQSSAGSDERQRVFGIQQQNIKLAGDWEKARIAVQQASPEAANKFLGEFNAANNTNYGLRDLNGPAPQIDVNTGRVTQPSISQGAVQPQPTGAYNTAALSPEVERGIREGAVKANIDPDFAVRAFNSSPRETQEAIIGQLTANQLQSKTPLPNESPTAFANRQKKVQEEQAKEVTKGVDALKVYNIIKPVADALSKATNSGLGSTIDSVAQFFGYATEGAIGTAQLRILSDRLLKAIPRFEGPQSDRDVESYKEAAGSLANDKLPREMRQAAFQTILDLNKKYYPDLDWTFGGGVQGGNTQSGQWKRIQ